MLRKFLLSSIILSSLIFNYAFSEELDPFYIENDIKTPKIPAPHPCLNNFSGFYLGAAGGVGYVNYRYYAEAGESPVGLGFVSLYSVNTAATASWTGLFSTYAGYSFIIKNRFLIAPLVGWTYLDPKTTNTFSMIFPPNFGLVYNVNLTLNLKNKVSALMRAGVLVSPSSLFYLVGGYASARAQLQSNAFYTTVATNPANLQLFTSASTAVRLNGYVVGTGIEQAIGRGFSFYFTYLYSHYIGSVITSSQVTAGTATDTLVQRNTVHVGSNELLFGLNYYFRANHKGFN